MPPRSGRHFPLGAIKRHARDTLQICSFEPLRQGVERYAPHSWRQERAVTHSRSSTVLFPQRDDRRVNRTRTVFQPLV